MKKEGHPEYGECEVTCACGNKLMTHGVMPTMHLDICSACHPFYTGKHKLVDTAGRIEKFNRKYKTSNTSSQTQAG